MERVRTSPGQRLHGERCSGDPGQTLAPDDRPPGAGQQVDTQHGGPQWAEGDQADRPQLPEDLGERHQNRDTCATGGGVVHVHVGVGGVGFMLSVLMYIYVHVHCTNVHVHCVHFMYVPAVHVRVVMYIHVYACNIVFL